MLSDNHYLHCATFASAVRCKVWRERRCFVWLYRKVVKWEVAPFLSLSFSTAPVDFGAHLRMSLKSSGKSAHLVFSPPAQALTEGGGGRGAGCVREEARGKPMSSAFFLRLWNWHGHYKSHYGAYKADIHLQHLGWAARCKERCTVEISRRTTRATQLHSFYLDLQTFFKILVYPLDFVSEAHTALRFADESPKYRDGCWISSEERSPARRLSGRLSRGVRHPSVCGGVSSGRLRSDGCDGRTLQTATSFGDQ